MQEGRRHHYPVELITLDLIAAAGNALYAATRESKNPTVSAPPENR